MARIIARNTKYGLNKRKVRIEVFRTVFWQCTQMRFKIFLKFNYFRSNELYTGDVRKRSSRKLHWLQPHR